MTILDSKTEIQTSSKMPTMSQETNGQHGPIAYDALLHELEQLELGSKDADGKKKNPLANQFWPFQIDGTGEENQVKHLHEMEPVFEGKADRPDVLLRIEMIDFHLGNDERVDKKTRATMNISVQQENPVDAALEPLYWVAATGLDLYQMIQNPTAGPEKKEKADLHEAFGRRPIELPGGTAILKFDVKKHKETRWWEYIFAAVNSKAGQGLFQILGLPGVALSAVNAVEDLIRRIDDRKGEILFQSQGVPLVFTQQAKDRKLADNPHSKVGALKPGLFILTQGHDYRLFKEQAPFYHYMYQQLFPAGTAEEDFLDPDYIDPFENCTYAVFRVAMVDTKLNPAYEELKF